MDKSWEECYFYVLVNQRKGNFTNAEKASALIGPFMEDIGSLLGPSCGEGLGFSVGSQEGIGAPISNFQLLLYQWPNVCCFTCFVLVGLSFKIVQQICKSFFF